MERSRSAAWLALGAAARSWAAGLLVVAAGCASPAIYSTARTTPKGEWSGTVAGEVALVPYESPASKDQKFIQTITPPTLEFRYGLGEDLDVGFRAPHFTGLAGDIKWNFLRGEVLDVAIAGRALVWYPGMLHAIVPVIVDLNLGDVVTLVGHTGGGAALGSTDNEVRVNQSVLIYAGPLIDGGLGVNVKLTGKTALHVEGACLFSVPFDKAKLCSVGVALNFGDVAFARKQTAPGFPK